MDKIREYCKEIVATQINRIIQPERMDEFLHMVANFPHMRYENVLLLLYQMPEAMVVCGKCAWRHLNTKIKEGERAIALFAPRFAENIVSDIEERAFLYQEIVGVYDVTQTEQGKIDVLPKPEIISLEQILKERFDVIIFEDFDETAIKSKLLQSLYSETEHILYMGKGIAETKRELEYLKLYVRLLVQEEAEKEYIQYTEEAERFLLNILCRHFGLLYTLEECYRRSKLYQSAWEEKRYFLEQLSKLAHRAVSELSGQRNLSFEETVFCNIFFETEVQEDTLLYIGKAIELAADKEMKDRLQDFMLLVRNMNNDTYRRLYTMRMEQKLFSYPPVNIKEQEMRDEINE